MAHHHEIAQLLLESGAVWASGLNVPWFLAGAGLGAPAAVGAVSTGNSKLLSLVTTVGGVLGGVAADRLSTTAMDSLAGGGGDLTCYDVLTKGVGPACLLLVVLSRGVRGEPSAAGGWGEGSRPRAHSLLGSLYETLLAGGGWGGGGRVGADAMALSQYQNDEGPPFERGEVTVRGIYCSGLDAAITGRPPSSAPNGTDHGGFPGGADGGGGGGGGVGGIIAGGASRPFYVTLSLGGLSAKTSPRPGFSPRFTEVFPLGCDCPIRGAFLTIAVVDSFETGRSGRGDRVVGEVHLPLDAAQLVPGTSADHGDASYSSSSSSSSPFASGSGGGRPAYRLSGEWELQGGLGGSLCGASVGADVVVHGPPSPSSAAGRLRRRRESVGWYAR